MGVDLYAQARPVQLEALLRGPSSAAVAHVRNALSRAGCYETDAREFSNKALVVTFETDHAEALGTLPDLLDADGIHLSAASRTKALEAAAHPGPVAGTLHVELIHREPDAHTPIPSVPG